MLFGGGNSAVEAYDPTTGSFGRLANMPGSNVVWTFATLTDGRILALRVVGLSLSRTGSPETPGGLFTPLPPESARPVQDNSTEPVTVDGEIYGPAQDTWTDLGRLNLDRISFQVAPLPNGGAIVTGTPPGGMGAEVAELFDPKTGKSRPTSSGCLPPWPVARGPLPGPATVRPVRSAVLRGRCRAKPCRLGYVTSCLNGRGERIWGFAFQLTYVIVPAAGLAVDVA
jgi:hypothetical protein